MSRISRTLIVGVTLAALRLWAHHAFAAEYDENKIVTISGTVTSFQWSNPHAWLNVEGKDSTGATAKWRFELGSPNGLIRRGWKKGELRKGDQVTVDGYCAKNGGNIANARNVTMPDGRTLFGGFQSTPGAPAR